MNPKDLTRFGSYQNKYKKDEPLLWKKKHMPKTNSPNTFFVFYTDNSVRPCLTHGIKGYGIGKEIPDFLS